MKTGVPWILSGALLASLLGAGEAHAMASTAGRPPINWRPAAPNNYTRANRSAISGIVIHKAEGQNAAGWFANPAARASAHYDVHFDGSVWQSVADHDIAWHAGNWWWNERSIGIEHAGWSAQDDITEAEYRASAQLVAALCGEYGIPIDRQHIIGHVEVPQGPGGHWDPGPHWNWDYYLSLVRSFAGMGGAPPPPPAGGFGRPMLSQGAQGGAVVELQDLLRARGFDPGPSDGVFGPQTAAAVRGFQAAHGLAVDGVVGPQTWGALDGGAPAPAPAPAAAPAPAGLPVWSVLALGSQGPDVVALQDALWAHGFDPGPSDGIFGGMTLAAVRGFQAARGLVVDGVVGPQTWGALSQ